MNDDLISRQAAIDAILAQSIHGSVRELYEYTQEHPGAHWDEGLADAIDAVIAVDEVPDAQPQYEELTPEEAASEIASGSTMSAWYWLDDMIRLKQMGYVICRKR